MKIDKELLKQLYLIEHPSGNENAIISFILNYVHNIPNIYIELDHYNNLFITKNTTNPQHYVCMVSHMDEAQDYKEAYEVVIDNNIWTGRGLKSKKQLGLGCDDTNGICITLQMLKTCSNLKCVFTTEEEVGAKGAFEACFNEKFFENVQCFLQADRRGSSDLIVNTNGITCCSNGFSDYITDICDKYNYSHKYGTFTDVGILVEHFGISGVNISCGYYKEHTDEEYTNVDELENCLNFIHDIIHSIENANYVFKISKKEMNKFDYNSSVSSNCNYYGGYWDSSGHWVDNEFYFEDSYQKTNAVNARIFNDFYKEEKYQTAVDRCATCSTFDCMNCDNLNNGFKY